MTKHLFDPSDKLKAFDRYAAFTDLTALNEASTRPLRRTIRVNTLKSTIERFTEWARQKQWILSPVPWCPEGFFVERAESEEALGKDLLHQLGHTYIQEAASMLPVSLLDPQPGEAVLDLCAAPGSKTTQIAARMGNTGVIVANDMQEKRLWTLQQNTARCGAINVIVTKKPGEWFSKHMTERFDRVLCDAPCSAQGVVRSDREALQYGSPERIERLAEGQTRLLETAIHAARVGGRIVYSTCTLTPEENEEVVRKVVEKFGSAIEVLGPEKWSVVSGQIFPLENAIKNSIEVQSHWPLPTSHLPLLRLWPQTYDTEGFFCAVLEKKAPTRDRTPVDAYKLIEEPIQGNRRRDLLGSFEKLYGTTFVEDDEELFVRADTILLTSEALAKFPLPLKTFSIGLAFVKGIRDGFLRFTHEGSTLRGHRADKGTYELTDAQLAELLEGKDTACPPDLRGDNVLRWKGMTIGMGLAKEGNLKNRIPRTVIRQTN